MDDLSQNPPTIANTSNLKDGKKNKESIENLWDEIGFHKPLAGFWYKLILAIIGMMIGVFLVSFFFNWMYPYPESMGYRDVSSKVFIVYITVFDLGTHMCMDRYIAETRIKNPKKMIQYIQYFIYYQLITGLIQTTTISIYALYYVPKTELAYTVWLMLIVSTTQYPGFLSVFNGVLGSLQHFDKTELLNFITGEVFTRISEIGFLFLGKWYGSLHPEIGVLMGIAIGSSVGLYVNQFFAMLLSGYFFSKTMTKENISIKDCFRIDFDWALAKDALWFGIRTGLPNVYGLVVSLIVTWELILFIPQYATFIVLMNLAGYIGGVMNLSMGVSMTPLISEAYLNGKKKLTQYYIGQSWRFTGLNQAFVLVIMMLVLTILKDAFDSFNIANYVLIIPFVLPQLIKAIQQPYTTLADSILTGTNHPNFLLTIRFIEENLKLFLMTLWVVWMRIPQSSGIESIAWILVCGDVGATLIKTIVCYVYIHRKIINLEIPLWQTFGAPFLSGFILFGLGFYFKWLLFESLLAQYGFWPTAVVIGLIFTSLSFGLYHPITTLLGGYDDDYLKHFEKAVKMSGPSKIVARFVYLEAIAFRKFSKLHNKYKMNDTEALKEAQELFLMKFAH